MADRSVIKEAKTLILTAQPDNKEARLKVWTLLNENDLLIGRARCIPPIEAIHKEVIRKTIAGEYVDPTTQLDRTFLAHLILKDETLLPERLKLKHNQLQQARAFFDAMDKDIRQE